MTVRVVIGLQWGDEGKGKIVDYLGQEAYLSARFNGGNNAGHTVEAPNGNRVAFHLLPASSLHTGMISVLGRGMVIDPDVLVNEIDSLNQMSPNVHVIVDPKAHIISYDQIYRDTYREETSGHPIGTTRRGVGPAYSDKMLRTGTSFEELMNGEPREIAARMPRMGADRATAKVYELRADLLSRCEIKDPLPHIEEAISQRLNLLLMGAHGVMLDIDHGHYPYVTSSSCIPAAVGTGLGVDPRRIDEVVGVMKVYSTRIGEGPLPTEMPQDIGDQLRESGLEYGSTTGRPRRMGFLDLPAIKYANRICRPDYLALTRIDILDEQREVPICIAYEEGDEVVGSTMKYTGASPKYFMMKGWHQTTGCQYWEDLHKRAREFIKMVEDITGIPVKLISTGPKRRDIIDLRG